MADSVANDICSLPHWARVAFAAHCGLNTLPLFEKSWELAKPERIASVESAIRLAQQSAMLGRPAAGLKAAMMNAVETAGVAQLSLFDLASDEPVPQDQKNCIISTFAAKVGEWAAMAALKGPEESANAALEAYTFARDALRDAEESEVLRRLQSELAALCSIARRNRWSDETTVPPSVFSLDSN